MIMTPLAVPVAVGVNVTAMLQLVPPASGAEVEQVVFALSMLNTGLLVDEMLVMFTAAVLLLVTVIYSGLLVVFFA